MEKRGLSVKGSKRLRGMEKMLLMAMLGTVLLLSSLKGASAGETMLVELREKEGYIIYRSEFDPKQAEKLKEEEKRKQEKSWEMLDEINVVPESAGRSKQSPPNFPPSR